jgi:hypothetical protein
LDSARAFGIGTIHLQTAGAAGSQGGQAELLIYGVKDLEGMKEMILESVVRSGDAMRYSKKGKPGDGTSSPDMMLSELVKIRRLIEEHRK